MGNNIIVAAPERNILAWKAIHRHDALNNRMKTFREYMDGVRALEEHTYGREVISAHDREVVICDPYTGGKRTMIMFASNNYLGLANHPRIREKVKDAIDSYGIGIGGPPLLNGYSRLMRLLEERLSDLKRKEACKIFSSGFAANLGILGGLVQAEDTVLYDELSHASLLDGLQIPGIASIPFKHNDVHDLEQLLIGVRGKGTCFVAVEGIYSMEGDLAPLDQVSALCKKYDAVCMVDDAHGTGIVGARGGGTADLFNCEDSIGVSMGTFSKTFAVTGGFVAGSADLIEYMRYFSRSYVFSAALTPITLAAILAGLDVIEAEPWLRDRLHANVKYAAGLLAPYGMVSQPGGGIISLMIPKGMNIRRAASVFHQQGIFVNSIEAPAVPIGKERFRLSFMAQHTRADIERLAEVVGQIWNNPSMY